MRPEDRAQRIKEAKRLAEDYRAFFSTDSGKHLLDWIADAEDACVDSARRTRERAPMFLDQANGVKMVWDHIEGVLSQLDEP